MMRATLSFDVLRGLTQRAAAPKRVVLTCADGVASAHGQSDLRQALTLAQVKASVHGLVGGNAAWRSSGQVLVQGEKGWVAERIDRYRRPYEGTANPHAAMQAYLDWEFGLVEQLKRDGTHHFQVI